MPTHRHKTTSAHGQMNILPNECHFGSLNVFGGTEERILEVKSTVHKPKRFVRNTTGTLTVEISALQPRQHDKSPLHPEVAQCKASLGSTYLCDLYFCCLNQHILILHEGRMFSHTKSYMIMYLQY